MAVDSGFSDKSKAITSLDQPAIACYNGMRVAISAAYLAATITFIVDRPSSACYDAVMETIPRFLSCPSSSFFLFGPRGTGKSTWLQQEFPDALFVDLLLQETYHRYITSPDALADLVAGNADVATFVIDEIQKVPELLTVIHRLIQAHPDVRFVMTGSSARKLKRAGVDLLAGRAVLTTSHPFMAAELGSRFSLDRALAVGLVPLVWTADDPGAVLRTYIALYLREEVQMEGLVRNVGDFSRFLQAISFSHGGVLNVSEVARECQVSRKTVEGYVSTLEDLLVGYCLPVFARRAKRKLVVHRKFYVFDAGVFRSLRPRGPLDSPEEIDGGALEGLVMQHLRAWSEYAGGSGDLFFWRTKSGSEVDFVVYCEHDFAAIEVKNSGKVNRKDLRGLRAFGEDYPQARLIFLYRGREQMSIDGVLCVPCERFLMGLEPGQPLPDGHWRRA